MIGYKDYRMLARYTHMRARMVANKLERVAHLSLKADRPRYGRFKVKTSEMCQRP
jgi:hypothetical protein